MEMDDYTVWIGILLTMSAVIGATFYIPLLVLTLLGLAGITLTAIFMGVRQ